MAFHDKDSEFFGGAVLADRTCGSVSFRDASGSDIFVSLTDDPEYTMSGLYEPVERYSGY